MAKKKTARKSTKKTVKKSSTKSKAVKRKTSKRKIPAPKRNKKGTKGEYKKQLIIAGISIALIVALSLLLFFRSDFVGQAIFVDVEADCNVGSLCFGEVIFHEEFGNYSDGAASLGSVIDTAYVSEGEIVYLVLMANVSADKNITAYRLNISYDNTAITMLDGEVVRSDEDLVHSWGDINHTTGTILVDFFDFNGDQMETTDGSDYYYMLIFNFSVDALNGTEFDFTFNNVEMYHNDEVDPADNLLIDGMNAHFIVGAPTPANTITTCDTEISSPGNYQLSSNLTGCTTNGIEITSDNVNLDCEENSINGTGTGSGIYVHADNVTIQNCAVYDFVYGIFLSNSHSISLNNNIAIDNLYGVNLYDSENNILSSNTVSNNDLFGISLDDSGNNTLSGNTVENNGVNGIFLDANNNYLSNNYVCGNSVQDLYCDVVVSSAFGTGNSFNIVTQCSDNWPTIGTNYVNCTPETCDNSIDDNGDTLIDCADPTCDQTTGPNNVLCEYATELTCNDGLDNDADSLIDCDDTDCASDPNCDIEICDDGTDNDGDGIIDCADSDCSTNPICLEEGTECNDGIDNDGDGDTDCVDPDCSSSTYWK